MEIARNINYPGCIILTGSGSGIGLAVAEDFLTQGVRDIILQYRNRNDELFALLNRFNLNPDDYAFKADLSDEVQVNDLFNFADKKYKSVYAVINIAGSSSNAMSWKITKDDFLRVINNNLLSTFLCTKAFLPKMREQAFGRIINFSSVVAFSGVVGASHYCSAKSGIIGLSKALSLELANKNITVNSIALGYFDRGLIDDVPAEMQNTIIAKTPMGRLGNATEISSLLNYILGAESEFITGQVFHINGGLY